MILLDDVISEELRDNIENILLSELPWFYNKRTADLNNCLCDTKDVIDSFQFYHTAYNSSNHTEYLESFLEIPKQVFKELDLYEYEVVRVKANLTTKHECEDKYQIPHIDLEGDTKVLLYYVNDSDGDTILFKEKYGGVDKGFVPTIETRVSPKRGRVIVFDGNQYHSGSYPTKYENRMVINFVLRKRQEIN